MFKLIKKFSEINKKTRILRSLHVETKNFDHCVNLVKNNNYENYLYLMLLPKEIMRSAFAIHAFNIGEI